MSVNQILNDFGKKIVKELSNNLNTYGHNGGRLDASGQLRSSIRFTTKILGDEFVFQLSMKDYYEWVDEGRKPGKWPGAYPVINPSNILKWMQTKPSLQSKIGSGTTRIGRQSKKSSTTINISKAKSLAFLISRKIKENGIKPTNFFSDVYNDEALLDLKKKLSVEMKKEITIELTQIK